MLAKTAALTQTYHFNTKSIILNTKFTILNAKFIIFTRFRLPQLLQKGSLA